MTAFVIHKNAPVNQPLYQLDRDGVPIPIDPAATYLCDIKKSKEDSDPVLRFITGGGIGQGEIEIDSDFIEGGLLADMFVFTTPNETLLADLEPGAYVGDILRTDDKDWGFSFPVVVDRGVTYPGYSGTMVVAGMELVFVNGTLMSSTPPIPYTGVVIAGGVQFTYANGRLTEVI